MNKLFSVIGLILLFSTTIQAQHVKKNMETPDGRNIISFIPFSAFTRGNVGVGFSYERNTNEYIGIKIPVWIAINQPGFSSGVELKLYPAKNNGIAKYAVAPMIMFGTSKEEGSEIWGPNGFYTPIYQHTRFGFVLNQSLNITIMREIYIGFEGGIGINYFDQKKLLPGNAAMDSKISFLSQFHISTGYRF